MTFRQPPEWAHHEAVWIGWPSHPELWADDLEPARAEVLAFARAISAKGAGERVFLVAADAASAAVVPHVAGIETLIEPFGDIWLRDTGPLLLAGPGPRRAATFRFNWWGEKYHLAGDETLAGRLAAKGCFAAGAHDWILEGGAIDVDGTGLAVTTEQCLLHPNRNPGLPKAEITARLAADLGLDRVLWLGDGLANDHTDGHVDNLARFVGVNRLAIPEPDGDDDPNTAIYRDAAARARAFGVEVVPLPSPGLVERDGAIVPASYMNFYIGNAAVVIPTYGAANDAAAVAVIGALFPGRRAIGLRADHILTGGGQLPLHLATGAGGVIALAIRAVLSGIVVAIVALTARRSPALGALIASLPLISLLGMIWLWRDTHDRVRLAAHVEATFWYVLPSLPMFLLIPAALRRGMDFWAALAAGCALTMLLYLLTIGAAARFGVKF